MPQVTTTTIPWAAIGAARDAAIRHAVAYYQNATAGVRRPAGVIPSPNVEQSAPAAAPPAGLCESLLATYFADDYRWAHRVVMRESRCTPSAVNYEGCDTSGRTNSHAMGLFQMCYPLHEASFVAAGCQEPLDAECNVRAARKLYDRSGRAPWGG